MQLNIFLFLCYNVYKIKNLSQKSGCLNRNGDYTGGRIKMRRLYLCICLVCIVFMTVAVSSGCSKNEERTMTQTDSMDDSAPAGYGSGGNSYDEEEGSQDKDEDYSNSEAGSYDNVRKVIKNGEIAVEVKNVDEAYKGITEILDSVNGEEFSKDYSIYDKYKRMELELKIPPEKLDIFQEKLTEYVGKGKIRSINIRSRDITSDYFDVQARLESYKAGRDRIRELLDEAQTVEETLKIQNELNRLQAEIDSMQGRIKMWNRLVDMATITLYIDEEEDPLKHTETIAWKFSSPNQIWHAMRNGFVNTANILFDIIIWIVIISVALIPVLIPGGIIAWFIIRRKRNKKTTKASEK